MKNILFILFLSFLFGCESYIYEKYKIITNKSSNSYKKEERYIVKKGDNLYSISRRFKISIREIIDLNNIALPYKIFPNQKIIIPKKKSYIVKKGDTLFSISRKNQTDIFTISKINNIKNINQISLGQKLIIPNIKFKKTSFKKVKNLKKKKLKKEVFNNTKSISFKWPLNGKIISKFGSSKPGFYNDGINISSSVGKEVIASDDGKVIYTGNEIPGYGNIVLIKHSKNWITAYAHLKEIFSKKGSIVKQGQLIGSVGKSGNVRKPQLHFEIRKGKVAVDPLKFLS